MTKEEILSSEQNEQAVASEHEIRVQKVKKMIDQGINPWPEYKKIDATCKQVIYDFEHDISKEKEYAAAGRIISSRDHGKTIFINIQDRTGRVQVYLKKDIIGDKTFEFLTHYIDVGDIVWVKGTVFKTKMGEITLRAQEVELLSKCLYPLPEKYHGLVDVEQRYRYRYLDLISNQESLEKFKTRSKVVQSLRNFLLEKEFLEVETPMLHPIAGGANARPFTTHHNAYDMELFLRIAPELYLKRLVVGGLERVFEINRNFRNEGVSTKHNPEFTMMEFYMAHGDYHDGIALTEGMISQAVSDLFGTDYVTFGEHKLNFSSPFKKMSIQESLLEIGGLTQDQISEKNIDKTLKVHSVKVNKNARIGGKMFALFEELVESKIIQPTFITDYPVEVSPLAKRDPKNKEVTARFELFCMGFEVANGFTELNDPFDQADRFKMQVESKEGGDEEAHEYDADYIKALEYALPPTVGVGLGIDRLVMLLTNTTSIKDVILFPTLKKLEE